MLRVTFYRQYIHLEPVVKYFWVLQKFHLMCIERTCMCVCPVQEDNLFKNYLSTDFMRMFLNNYVVNCWRIYRQCKRTQKNEYNRL